MSRSAVRTGKCGGRFGRSFSTTCSTACPQRSCNSRAARSRNKVDRLSRSLLDFARLIETFDRHRVAFVSVTQQFNTATSMGRLVLNVLLSFAQFEREIISERTRDKIAAARRKGKWTGGMPLLGYDVDPRRSTLIVNEEEATQIRAIFELYLEHQSLITTIRELDGRGWTNKHWTTRKGHQ